MSPCVRARVHLVRACLHSCLRTYVHTLYMAMGIAESDRTRMSIQMSMHMSLHIFLQVLSMPTADGGGSGGTEAAEPNEQNELRGLTQVAVYRHVGPPVYRRVHGHMHRHVYMDIDECDMNMFMREKKKLVGWF